MVEDTNQRWRWCFHKNTRRKATGNHLSTFPKNMASQIVYINIYVVLNIKAISSYTNDYMYIYNKRTASFFIKIIKTNLVRVLYQELIMEPKQQSIFYSSSMGCMCLNEKTLTSVCLSCTP